MFKGVTATSNYTLKLTLDNGENFFFDVKPYLEKGVFTKLKDMELFKTVRLDSLEGVEWACYNLSLSKNTLVSKMY